MDSYSHCDARDDLADFYAEIAPTPPVVEDLPKGAILALTAFRSSRAPLTPSQRHAFGAYAPGVVGTCPEFYALVEQLRNPPTADDGKAIRATMHALGTI